MSGSNAEHAEPPKLLPDELPELYMISVKAMDTESGSTHVSVCVIEHVRNEEVLPKWWRRWERRPLGRRHHDEGRHSRERLPKDQSVNTLLQVQCRTYQSPDLLGGFLPDVKNLILGHACGTHFRRIEILHFLYELVRITYQLHIPTRTTFLSLRGPP